MNYIPIRKDDFDKSFKYGKQSFLCYSGKKLKELHPEKNYSIVGLARKTGKDTEQKLVLGGRKMPVYEPEQKNLLYKNIGFIPVENEGGEENLYVAVQNNRTPFLIWGGSMMATTIAVCTILILGDPRNLTNINGSQVTQPAPRFNPLPPVDTNLEDCPAVGISNDRPASAAPKGGGKVTLSYKSDAELKLSSGEVTMEYQNPATSSHDAVLNLYVVSDGKEYLVAKSGLIPAGKQLKTMQMTADQKLFSAEGKYDAEYRVYYYDPVTGERALTEATINDITLTVRNS